MSKPGIILGAMVGGLITAPLIALSALANQLAGLPFMPFDLFPLVRDYTPGRLLIFTIERMADAIIALNLGRVDKAAKIAEQAMTMGMLLAFGIAAGVVLFALLNAANKGGTLAHLWGLGYGLVVGAVMALISARYGLSASLDVPMAARAAWLLFIFAVWGLVLGWSYRQLAGEEAPMPAAMKAVSH